MRGLVHRMDLRRQKYPRRLGLERGCWPDELALSFWAGLNGLEEKCCDGIDLNEIQLYLKRK